MNEPPRDAADRSRRSFGEELRRERELRQISLREIAEATKINFRFLEALENNDFDALPGGFFTRGFIKSYARHIGLNEEAMVNAFLMELNHQKMRSGAEPENALDQIPEPPPRSAPNSHAVRTAIAAISLLAFFGLAFLLWNGVRHMGRETAAPDAPSTESSPPTRAAEPEAAASTQLVAPEPEPPVAAPLPESLQVHLVLGQRAWVRLLCDGRELINRTIDAGSRRSFECRHQVRISSSSPEHLHVEINGRVLSLPPLTGGRALPLIVTREDWPPQQLEGEDPR